MILRRVTSKDKEESISIADCKRSGTGPFDDYLHCGLILSEISLYDYKSTVVWQKESQYSGGKGIHFLSTH